jgi:hypothetical protein
MKKRTYFNSKRTTGWPTPEELKPYFFGPPGEEWFNTGGNDGAVLQAKGLYGTENGIEFKTRIDANLYLYGAPGIGVTLQYDKYGGGYRENYNSKGDLRRLKEYVRSLHGDPLSIGLFVPFSNAFHAVKEFIENDGELPKCIEWVAAKDLPPEAFPDPAEEAEQRFRAK